MWAPLAKLLARSKNLNASLGEVIFETREIKGQSPRSFLQWRVPDHEARYCLCSPRSAAPRKRRCAGRSTPPSYNCLGDGRSNVEGYCRCIPFRGKADVAVGPFFLVKGLFA